MSNFRDEMPVSIRHEGEWAGTYTVIDNDGKVLQAVLSGGESGLPDRSFVGLTVADDDEDPVVRSVDASVESETYPKRGPVAQASRGGLDTGDLAVLGVPAENRFGLAETGEALLREEAPVGQDGVKCEAPVTFAQDTAVPSRPLRIFGIVIQDVFVEDPEYLHE